MENWCRFILGSAKDFKRIFSIISWIAFSLDLVYRTYIIGEDFTLFMFIMSNLLSISDLLFASKFKRKIYNKVNKFIQYLIIIVMFLVLFNINYRFLNKMFDLDVLKWIYGIISFLVFIYCIILLWIVDPNEKINNTVRTSMHSMADNFNGTVDKFADVINNEKGGWSNFVRTPEGRAFAKAVKARSLNFTPRDHKKHTKHRKGRRSK